MNDVEVIANKFISWSLAVKKRGYKSVPIHPIALQKLVYIANAISLSEHGAWLTNEQPQVGQYGPVFPSLFPIMLKYGLSNITELIPVSSNPNSNVVRMHENEASWIQKQVLEDTCHFYVMTNCDHTKLTSLAGGSDKDWESLSSEAGGENCLISERLITKHYNRTIDSVDFDNPIIIPRFKETVSDQRTVG